MISREGGKKRGNQRNRESERKETSYIVGATKIGEGKTLRARFTCALYVLLRSLSLLIYPFFLWSLPLPSVSCRGYLCSLPLSLSISASASFCSLFYSHLLPFYFAKHTPHSPQVVSRSILVSLCCKSRRCRPVPHVLSTSLPAKTN